MLSIILKWAAILFPIVWKYVKPLLEKSKLNDDLQWILPVVEDVVGTVERTSGGASGETKFVLASSLIDRNLKNQDPARAAKVPRRTVNKAIELALDVATETKIPIPSSAPSAEQYGTQVS